MRVLIIGHWPIAAPTHGGQIRATRILQAYRQAGHDARFVGLFDPATTLPSERTDADHPITPAILRTAERMPGTPNIGFWRALAAEPASIARYRQRVAEFAPDVIQLEEPFLWPVVQRLIEMGALTGGCRVLHSSYNVEHSWRRQSGDLDGPHSAAFAAEIEVLETEIARRAEGVCVVSQADAEAFRKLGARRVAVAPNGADMPTLTASALRTVRQYLGAQPFALFVSSAHPPNASGIMRMIEGAPGLRLRHGIVVICGTVDQLLRPHVCKPALQHLFRDIRLLGRVPSDLLAAFYSHARVALVPRDTGGGSNLKTAEALLSGRPIVATTRAFVGFETFAAAAGVRIADEPAAFWRETDALLAAQPAGSVERNGTEELAWPRALAPMLQLAQGAGDN